MTKKTNEEYKKDLSAIEYAVTRESATEELLQVNTGTFGSMELINVYVVVLHYLNQMQSLMLDVDGQVFLYRAKVHRFKNLEIRLMT
jgi:hypothetical protein